MEIKYLPFPQGKFFYLLVSLLLLLFMYPFFAETVVGLILLDLFFTAVLLFGIYVISSNRHILIICVVLGLPSLGGKLLTYFVSDSIFTKVGYITATIIFIFMAGVILMHVLRSKKVVVDTIYGAICVYFLIGIAWAFLYSAIEAFNPGSFLIGENEIETTMRRLPQFLYYSFVTLTSLGLGDISPVKYVSRTFTYLEAITGQFYMLILIARLVGLHIAGSLNRNKEKKRD